MTNAPFSVGAVSLPAKIQHSISGTSSTATAAPNVDTTNFGAVLAQLSDTAISNLRSGETAAIEGLQGKSSTREVVDAVMKAEQSLQTVIAVRDKVISAYLEISRMAI